MYLKLGPCKQQIMEYEKELISAKRTVDKVVNEVMEVDGCTHG